METSILKTIALRVGILDLVFNSLNSLGFGLWTYLLYMLADKSDRVENLFDEYYEEEADEFEYPKNKRVRAPVVLIGICFLLHLLNLIPIINLLVAACCQTTTSSGRWTYKFLVFWQFYGITQQVYLVIIFILGVIFWGRSLLGWTKVFAPTAVPFLILVIIRLIIVGGCVILIRHLKQDKQAINNQSQSTEGI